MRLASSSHVDADVRLEFSRLTSLREHPRDQQGRSEMSGDLARAAAVPRRQRRSLPPSTTLWTRIDSVGSVSAVRARLRAEVQQCARVQTAPSCGEGESGT